VKPISYLDLFSGAGGFRYGLDLAGVSVNKEYHSEIDKHASATYAKHYNQSENLGDIKSIKPFRGTINGTKINLITFGFPCQDLSIAGKGAGLGGDRSGLFYEATRLIRELKPEVFIFENVKGLLTNNGGKDFEQVLREIADIGLYECQWQLLNTRWFLPQNRERVYFVGFIRGKPRKQVFPIGEEIELASEPRESTEMQVASTIAGSGGHIANGEYKGMNLIKTGTLRTHNDGKGLRETKDGLCPTIPARAREDGSGQPFVAIKNNQAIPVLTPDREEKRQNGRRFKENGDDMFTLTAQDKHGVFDGYKIRRLTPMECERLQGFPDGWTCEASDTQRYKMMGNAVSPVVPAEIFKRIYG
jgi:DNA (cytosine-5)-methyltransferase 1